MSEDSRNERLVREFFATFRDAFPECQAYGFFPHRHMALDETYPMMHAADERIDLRDLAFAARAYRDLTTTLLG